MQIIQDGCTDYRDTVIATEYSIEEFDKDILVPTRFCYRDGNGNFLREQYQLDYENFDWQGIKEFDKVKDSLGKLFEEYDKSEEDKRRRKDYSTIRLKDFAKLAETEREATVATTRRDLKNGAEQKSEINRNGDS